MAAAGPVDFAGVAASSGDHQNVSSDRNCPLSLLLITLVLVGMYIRSLVAETCPRGGAKWSVIAGAKKHGKLRCRGVMV